jgi:hypothetical protein
MAIPSQLLFFFILPQRRSLNNEECLDQDLWRGKKSLWVEENCVFTDNSFINKIKDMFLHVYSYNLCYFILLQIIRIGLEWMRIWDQWL